MKNKENYCNVGAVYSDLGCIAFTVLGFIAMVLFCLSLAGCGHNTGMFLVGKEAKIGFDSQNAIPSIMYVDGVMATDISRENSGWVVEINNEDGITIGDNGAVKGIKSISRYVGPQITGNLIDLAKSDPELARSYVRAIENYWRYQCLLKGDSANTGKADSAIHDR